MGDVIDAKTLKFLMRKRIPTDILKRSLRGKLSLLSLSDGLDEAAVVLV